MTGVNINKIRHYAPGFNNRTTRLDADMSALLFKAGTRVISSSERLIADVSVKAAIGNSNSDDKKRGLQSAGQSKYINVNGLVYDPEAKKQEGQYFKSWVTERERIDAMRSNDPFPNWGWVDINPENKNRLEAPRNSKGKITRYPVNPRTGEPMKNFGFDQEFKSLGPTIGEKNPGGKLLARTARAFGLVIDSLGKFRCPPGTPAANRFTNERGEGCFDISPSQVRQLVSNLSNLMQAPNDRQTSINSLVAAGVNIAEIRKSYKENGIAGLMSLARRVGINYVGDRWNDASYVSQISTKLREVSDLTMGAQSRMEKIAQEKAATIDFLAEYYGITETDEYKKINEIIKAMSDDPDSPLAPNQFELLFRGGTPPGRGGTPESHEDWVIDSLIETHIEAINQKLGLGGTPDVIKRDPAMMARVAADAKDEYLRAKGAGEVTPLTQFIDAGIRREKEFRLGAFEDMVITAYEQPHVFTMPNGNRRVYTAQPTDDLKLPDWKDYKLNGMAIPEAILINSGPAIQGFRDTPPAGYMDLYEATGGDIDDQWRAVASAMDADERLRSYSSLYSVDLAATEGRGWRDFGAQTSAHERAHWGQMDAIFQYHADNGTGSIDSLTNKQLMDLTSEFMEQATPEILSDVFGIDIDDLIDKRFDALAGAYSQVKQQEALGELVGGSSAADFNYARTLALMETLAELKANKAVGLIGDDPELDAILEKMDPLPPLTGGSISPSGGIVPSRPDGSPAPRFVPSGRVRPTLPGSAPALPANAGKVVTKTPGRSGGRGARGPVDPFEKERYGKVPTMIKEGRFTLEDIDEFLYGEDGKGGLKRMLESVANMKTKKNGYTDPALVKRKRLLNELVDTMGVSFSELEALALKAKRGEPLTPEEKSKLVNAISHLRNGANEFKAKSLEARRKYEDYRNIDVTRATGDGSEYDEKDTNVLNLEQIQDEIEMYEKLFMRVGRGIAPAVHDILTMTENGPYPPRLTARRPGPQPLLGIDIDGADGLASKQASRLSPQELSALSSAVTNPPRILSSSNPQNIAELTSTLEDIENVKKVFERNNLTPPTTVADNELKNAAPVMSGLDKSILPSDMVVELEIDTPEDTSPGSIYEMSQISSAQLITDSNTEEVDVPRSGFSSTTGMRTKAGIAGRLIASKKTRKLLEKAGVDAERTDVVQLMSEVAIGFSVGGPAGALIPIARRGSRDVAEQALKMMVERGWIEQDLANKIEKYGLDRIATEGLPDEILNLAESAKDKLLTEESKRRALDFGSVLQERSIELSDAAREKVSEISDAGKEKALELAGSGIEKAKKLRNRLRGGDSSPTDAPELISISGPEDARRVIDEGLPAAVKTEKEAYTILTELAKMANEAKALGTEAPNYDFCKVSIPGTNLFCGDSKGIPRKKMPQFSGEPTPGSPADSRPKNKKGEVDGTDDFIKHMEAKGIKIEEKEVLASTLRASQNELVGEKVAGMMTNTDFDPAGEAIFVSRDGYVIDGHHRWAAQVGRDLEDGNIGDLPLNVRVVDMDIEEVLEEANKFASEFGIAPKTAGNDAVAVKSVFVNIQFKQLGEPLVEKNKEPEEEKNTKKQKVRIAVPAGSKGKIESGKTKASNMILPPGKMKFTGVGEDGMPEAEIVEQMSAAEYMKNVEKMSSEIASSSNKPSIKKMAKLRADTAKKMRQEMTAKSGTPQSMSGISKVVFDKSNSIMERGKAAGINFFTLEKIQNGDTDIDTSEYVRLYQEKLTSVINNYSKSLPTRLFDDEISSDTKKFIYSNSVKEVVKAVNEVAMLIHNDIDRRARVSMSKSSLEQFVGSGKIANIDVDSESLKMLKTKRDAMLGNTPGIREFSFTPIELIHGILIEKVEKQLYENGTHVGSEEFTDYGRGIELILRAENSPRIGYGRKESYKNGGIFVQINEEDEALIQASIFGQMFMSKDGAEEYLAEIIEASLSGDYSKLIKKNNEDIFEAFIVGEISLNDVEHIKIPLSIFNTRKKRVPKSSMIGGADSINIIFMNRGVSKDKIKDFFDKDGTIGGGYTPKHLSYLNELEAAEEFKENLISLGISDVIFTNKDGIDIMGEDTWMTPPPTKKKGKDALKEIARNEVMSIIDKIAPPPKKAKPKKEPVKK